MATIFVRPNLSPLIQIMVLLFSLKNPESTVTPFVVEPESPDDNSIADWGRKYTHWSKTGYVKVVRLMRELSYLTNKVVRYRY